MENFSVTHGLSDLKKCKHKSALAAAAAKAHEPALWAHGLPEYLHAREKYFQRPGNPRAGSCI
jgi:hypothetical protein